MPRTRDAAVGALSRPPGLYGGHRRAEGARFQHDVLMAIVQHGVTDARMERLSEVVSVDRRTLTRWRGWWRDTFTATPFWRIARARFMPPVENDKLPASLLQRFTGEDAEPLVALLRFIGPLTGGDGMQAR